MLVTKKVIVKWNNTNRERYESLGYGSYNRGEPLEIEVLDLSPYSRIRVELVCDYCNNPYSAPFNSVYKNIVCNGKDCCPKCTGKKTSDITLNKRVGKYYSRLEDICNENNYILLTQKKDVRTIKDKVKYICPKHGEIIQPLENLIIGCRCNLCGNDKIAESNKYTSDKVEQLINSFNGNILLNKEDYKGVFHNNLKVKCSCGRSFLTSYANYENGKQNRCSTCAKSESYGEFKIRKYLEHLGLEYEIEKRFSDCKYKRTLPFDFYIPSYNLVIEFDGAFHFYTKEDFDSGKIKYNMFISSQETQRNDKIKNEYCKRKGIHILRIPFLDSKNIEKLIDDKLKEITHIDKDIV